MKAHQTAATALALKRVALAATSAFVKQIAPPDLAQAATFAAALAAPQTVPLISDN